MSYGVTQPVSTGVITLADLFRKVQMYVYPPSFQQINEPIIAPIVLTYLPKQIESLFDTRLLALKNIKALPLVLSPIQQDIFQNDKWLANGAGTNFKNSIWLSKSTMPQFYTHAIFDVLIDFNGTSIEDIYDIDIQNELDCLNPYYLIGAWVTTIVGAEHYRPAYAQSLTFLQNSVRLDVDYTNPYNRTYLDTAYVFINTPLASVYKYAEIRFYFGDFITGEKLDSTLPDYYEAMHNLAWYIGEEIVLPNMSIDPITNEFVYKKPIRTIRTDFNELAYNTLVELDAPATFNGRLITEGLHLIAYNPVIEDLDVYYADRETLYLDWHKEDSFWAEVFETVNYRDVDYMVYHGADNIVNIKFNNLSMMPGRVFITSLKLVDPVTE